ncbi:MAG: sensor domain-containing diguanylate cyclase, partial [Candidatus Omnitrophica bacterium]|nr:sensor domain-containing diguanylate cyclase [Candidatus Omnitrophota bacterium]
HDFIINILGELFEQADSILFFGFNKEKDSLSLLRSLKRKHSVVKEKKGGVIDKWALHHNRSLLIEDLTKDFRFDANSVEAYKGRGAQSFIVSPLSIGHRLLGIIRVESNEPSSFTLDDLRFLRNICDLGTVVLERANLFASAQELAIKDSLTTLYLREYFFNRLEEELNQARNKGRKVGVIMLDIDDFKKINDNYGHIVGDFVLKKLAKILISIAGGTGNLISRFGGEEFIISIPECSKKELLRKGEEIRRGIEEAELIFRREKINFTVSLGAILAPNEGEDSEMLTQRVDKLLYQAKKEGKNKLCFSQ